jgi:DNA (cytosine-5)-methyltransferase 1
VAKRNRPTLSPKLERRIARLRDEDKFVGLPWVTVRDAISDLPDPRENPRNGVPNHVFNPGARSYPGHTGSPLDEPAKTLKAGDHGVPGGENMLLRPDGSIRYFTVREAARLQTFPDDYIFRGSWTETMRQLGNAVPVRLAEVMAQSVADTLKSAGRPRLSLVRAA